MKTLDIVKMRYYKEIFELLSETIKNNQTSNYERLSRFLFEKNKDDKDFYFASIFVFGTDEFNRELLLKNMPSKLKEDEEFLREIYQTGYQLLNGKLLLGEQGEMYNNCFRYFDESLKKRENICRFVCEHDCFGENLIEMYNDYYRCKGNYSYNEKIIEDDELLARGIVKQIKFARKELSAVVPRNIGNRRLENIASILSDNVGSNKEMIDNILTLKLKLNR